MSVSFRLRKAFGATGRVRKSRFAAAKFRPLAKDQLHDLGIARAAAAKCQAVAESKARAAVLEGERETATRFLAEAQGHAECVARIDATIRRLSPPQVRP